MRLNERVLKVSPLLTTPDEANRGCSEATLAGPFSPWEKVRMRVRGASPYARADDTNATNAIKCNRIKGFATPGHS